jgi:hypothetical protein
MFFTSKSKSNSQSQVIILSIFLLFSTDVVLVASKNLSSLQNFPDSENSKIWGLVLPDPSYHSAFVETFEGNLKTFDSLISYLPNSTFPLVEVKFESKKRDSLFPPPPSGPTKSTLHGLEKRDLGPTTKHRKSAKNKLTKTKRDTNQRRLVATIMDECESAGNRESYISEMKKSDLEVQIYGKCGAPCPGHSKADCLKHIDNHYKVRILFL